MAPALDTVMSQVRGLVDAVRDRCLWSLRRDYQPHSVEEALRTLDAIQRHGDLATFRKAGELKEWLSLHSSATSAG